MGHVVVDGVLSWGLDSESLDRKVEARPETTLDEKTTVKPISEGNVLEMVHLRLVRGSWSGNAGFEGSEGAAERG